MKDRIENEISGISVTRKKGTDYRLYYFKFHLSDRDYEENSKRPYETGYSEILGNDSIIELNEGECVCLIEMDQDREVGRCEHYYRGKNAAGRLKCRIKRARFWGKNTWRITFRCNTEMGDSIGSRHFKLCYGERQFAFPKEEIKVRGRKNRDKGKYFIALPDMADIGEVFVTADDVVQEKYLYDCKRK